MKYYMFNGLTGGTNKSKQKKELNKSKIIKISILCILIVLFIVFILLYENNNNTRNFFDTYIFRKVTNEEKVPSIEIDTSKDISIFAYRRYLLVLDQNVLSMYNKSGAKEHSLDIEISNPIFESNGNYLCIAEKGGQKIYLISNKNIVWQKEIEGNISSVNINKNGYVSIIISGTSYKTVVETFDPNGNELFKTYLSSTNVIDTDISNDNKYLAVAEANFSGIVVQSNIKIISIGEAKKNSSDPIKYTYSANADDLIINIKYNNKNDLICMYDKHIDILKNQENKELVNLKEEEALFADINLSSKIIKTIKKSDGIFNAYTELQIINNNNIENLKTYRIDSTPRAIYTQGNTIGVNLGTSVMFINENGWLVKEYRSNKEIQKVVFCDEIAGVVSKDRINIISL